MKYALVATTGWLLLVDLKSREVKPLEQNRTEYYGISWLPGSSELVLSHSGLDNAELTDISYYAQSERGWLSYGQLSSCEFLSQPHQIICAHDGRVVCANTGRNVVSVFDFAQPNFFQEAGISSARWDRLALDQITGDHLNSVFLKGERLYVIAHAHAKGSKLATFSYPDLKLIDVEPLGARTGLHNIWITDEGQRISCHSESGSLIDLDKPKPLWESGAAMYTRGLAASGDFVLVGESQKTGRDLRRSSMSGIWILDRRTWQAVDYLCLGPYGAVNEVRLLDVPDEAHHRHIFSGIESLLAKDVRTDLSKQRMNAANAVFRGKHIWTGYESIFGSPEALADGSKKTATDQLCLAIRALPSDIPLGFSYTVEPESGAHVSVVLGYKGQGADSHMAALLVQPAGDSASLSVWINDGNEWSHLPEIQAYGLPLSGRLQLVTTAHEATLSVDGVRLISLSAATLGIERCDQGLGIRWIGASVCPSEAAT
jgi:hypothetical protein